MKRALVRRHLSVALVSAIVLLASRVFGQETTDMLGNALDLVHQVETPAGPASTSAHQIDLLTQAIRLAQEAPNHRLQGHRVLAIRAIRSAIAEIRSEASANQTATYLHTADAELSTSISLAADPARPATGTQAPSVAPVSSTASAAPQSSEDYLHRGTARMNHGDWNGGMADYDQAIKLDPKNTRAYLSRGFAKQVKDPSGAIADYNQAIALDPKNTEAYEDLATVKWMHQDYDGTIAVYTQLIALDPKSWSSYARRAIAREAKGDLDGALADYNQDILLEPTDSNAFRNRGQLREKRGDLAGALADFNQAIALGLNDAYTYWRRAAVEKTLGDWDESIADYDHVISLDAKNDDSFVNLDEIYADRGAVKLAKRDLPGAIADYTQAIGLQDQNTQDDYFSIWVAQELQGKKAEANARLSSEMAKSAGFAWYWPANVSGFLLDEMPESRLMSAAASTDARKDGIQHCQAWYYAGIKHFLAGDKSTAAGDFQKCLSTNQKDESAYFFARAELKKMPR